MARNVSVSGAIVPEIRGLVGGVLKVARRSEPTEGGLAVEEVDGHAKIPLSAKSIEDLLVTEIHDRVEAMRLAQRNLLRKRWGQPAGEAVINPPLFLHA